MPLVWPTLRSLPPEPTQSPTQPKPVYSRPQVCPSSGLMLLSPEVLNPSLQSPESEIPPIQQPLSPPLESVTTPPHCASPQGSSSVLCTSQRRTVRWTPSSARRPVWQSTRPTCECAVSWPCAKWSTPIGETGNAGLGGQGWGSGVFICSSICPSSKRTEDQLWAKRCAVCCKSRQRGMRPGPCLQRASTRMSRNN